MLNRRVRLQIRRLPHASFLLPLYQGAPRMPPHCPRISLLSLCIVLQVGGPTCRQDGHRLFARISQHAPTCGVMAAAGDAVPTLFVQTTIKEFVRHVSRQTPSIFYTSWPRVYLGQVMPSNTKCFYGTEGITENSSPNQGVAARLDMKTFAHCFPAAAQRAYGARVELEAGLEPATC